MIDEPTIRQFFRRLNHKPYGLTELVAIGKNGKGIRATGFFEDEDAFLSASVTLSGTNNLYAGRNPRPFSFSSSRNKMDTLLRLRASDVQIQTLTAISLDIDPIRPKDQPATAPQREKALRFASLLQRFIGGYVDDSGNGAYLWFPFSTPIHVSRSNVHAVKTQCRQWQQQMVKSFSPSEHGLRVDGCFDFSRLKRVVGSFNHKAQRLSCFRLIGKPSDKVRDEILSLPKPSPEKKLPADSVPLFEIAKEIPRRFLQLLDKNDQLRGHWTTPNSVGDRSAHDWILGRYCVEKGITDKGELAIILMKNPFGKYRRDGRREYVGKTVANLVKWEKPKSFPFVGILQPSSLTSSNSL
jgi:hypothetical protein